MYSFYIPLAPSRSIDVCVCALDYSWFLIINVLMLLLLLFATCVTRRFAALFQTLLPFVIRWLLLFCVHKRFVCICFSFPLAMSPFHSLSHPPTHTLTSTHTLAQRQMSALCAACAVTLISVNDTHILCDAIQISRCRIFNFSNGRQA